jgi:methionyl-tRNA formyltransferase
MARGNTIPPVGNPVLKIAFFGSGGDGSMIPLKAVAERHQVICVVIPKRGLFWWRRSIWFSLSSSPIGSRDSISDWAREKHVPVLNAATGRDPDICDGLNQLAPDVICVSAFPWILGKEVLGTARRGALNVHPSLLPRHRGPVPLFWVYFHDDRQTGVTVHQMNEHADAGNILAQHTCDLPRGFSAERLHALNAARGAELLVDVLEKLETAEINPIKQDERLATYAPRVSPEQGMVNFREWEVERVWHFLSGLCPQYREPLQDTSQKAVRYETVLGFRVGDGGQPPGMVRRASHGWDLYCRGGAIELGDEPITGSRD